MRIFIFCLLILSSEHIYSQRISQIPDSLRNLRQTPKVTKKDANPEELNDEQIKQRLIALSLKNPSIVSADADIKIAEINKPSTKYTILSSLNAGANFNEFVFSKSPVASFYPRYNLGVSVPFNLFAKSKIEREVGDQNIIIANQLKDEKVVALKAEVLTRYEDYKEAREQLRLQKIFIEDDYSTYLASQKMYSDGLIKLDEMNKVYQSYINEQSKLVSRQRDFNVTIIKLEEIIGISLDKVIPNASK